MNRTCRYIRGSVWYAVGDDVLDNKHKSNSRVQKGNRYVIIFSSDEGNVSSDIVSVIPCSTQIQKKLSINVPVKGYDGKDQIALCNMLMPIDKSQLIEYKYTLSSDVMKEVEKGVLIANEMKCYIKNSEAAYTFDQLKSVINTIVSNRVETILKKRSEQKIDVSDIHNLIDTLCEQSGIDSLQKNHTDDNGKEPSEIDNHHIEENSLRERKNEGRRVWTKDMCMLFISDKDKYSRSKLAQMWKIKPSSISNTYYLCKKRLEKFE